MATILLTSNTIAENTEGQVRIGTLSIQDRPDETFIFTLDSELFEVVPDGEGSYDLFLKSGVTLDFESDPQFELAITVTDGAGDPVEVDPVIVDVTDVNEAPTDIAILGGSVADNADLGTLVATLQGEDPDEGDALTYTFVKSGQDHTEQSHAMFEIVGDEIQVKGDLSVGTHSLWVKVTDSGNPALSYVQEITLTVTVGNELPEVTFDLADVPEGAGAGTVVGTLAVSDPDGDDVTYSLVELDENGIERPSTMFRLDENGNVLVMDGVKLFQKDGAYPSFTVKASDGVDTVRSTYEVLLAENQEPVPAFESEELSRVVQEGTLVGVLSAYDEESDAVIFALEGVSADLLDLQDNGDGTWNVVVKAGVTLKYPDHTGFTVAVSDRINSFTETFHFNYLNEKPTISFEVAEVVDGAKAGTVVGTLTVSDAEGYDVEPILSSASAAVFDLVDNDDGTWSVVTKSRLDKNNSAQLEFTVTASDDENSVVETYELAIGDNQDPVVSSTPRRVVEGSGAGTIVGTVAAEDPEGDELKYSLVGSSAQLFELKKNGGSYDIVLRAGKALDFENQDHHFVQMKVSDGINTVEETLDLELVNVNEDPAVTYTAVQVNEGDRGGIVVGRLFATDPEGDDVSYELSEGAELFDLVDWGNGYYDIVTLDDVKLDYENKAHHALRIIASDGENELSKYLKLDMTDQVDLVIGSKRSDSLNGGTGSDILKGLAGNDTLSGGSGDDWLYGSSGKDILTGDKGKDIFVFDTKPSKKTNMDTVADFDVKDDAIWLDNKVFTKLGKAGSAAAPATLGKGFFKIGDKARDKDDHLVYNKKTGILSYDADGSGSKAAVEIAQLKKGLALKAADFFVI